MSPLDRSFSPEDRPMHDAESVQSDVFSSAEELRRRSRRSLFRAGLAAAPLILTLRNRAAWGQSDGGGTKVTGASGNQNGGLSEEQIEFLRRQIQQAEQSRRSGWLEADPEDF